MGDAGWVEFHRDDPRAAAELIAALAGTGGEVSVAVEPVPSGPPTGRWRRREASAPCSASVGLVGDYQALLTFPKGPRLSQRGALPASVVVDDDGRSDAVVTLAASTSAVDVVATLLVVLGCTVDEPLGDRWRAVLSDSTMPGWV